MNSGGDVNSVESFVAENGVNFESQEIVQSVSNPYVDTSRLKLEVLQVENHELTEENENLKKDKVNLNANLLSYWDTNKNHKWDSNKKIAYRKELKKVSEILLKKGFDRRWYISLGKEIWGPHSINKIIPKAPHLDENMMVSWDGKSGWVDIQDLHENKSQV